MSVRHTTALGLAVLMISSGAGLAAEQLTLTFEQALERAGASSVASLAARARVGEARAREGAARLRGRGNPVLETDMGRRDAAGGDSWDLEVAVSQGLHAAGSRAAGLTGAEMGRVAAEAGADAAVLDLQREVGEAFITALHAAEQVRLLDQGESQAARIVEIAERRLQAGEGTVLDVHLAQALRARSRALALAQRAGQARALGDLRALLGLDPLGDLTLRGEPGRVAPEDLDTLLSSTPRRADLAELQAEIHRAEAEQRLGRSQRFPETEMRLRYVEEGDDVILQGGVAFALPVRDRGQWMAAEAGARVERLRLEHEALRRAALARVGSAYEAHHRQAEAAAAVLEVVPLLDDGESLALLSYEAGQISLEDLLLVRRETLETRLAAVERQFEVALSGWRLETEAGVIP